MFIVYDKNGKECFHRHAVDAKEAIVTGNFFATNPVRPPAPPPPEIPVAPLPGQDIEPLNTPVDPDVTPVDPEEPEVELVQEEGKKRKPRQA